MRRVTIAGKLVTGDFAFDPHPLQTDGRLRRVVTACGPVTQQAIPAARLSLQQTPIRTKRLADRAGMNVKCIFADDRAWPDTIQELVFGHELAGRTGQNFDDLKCSSTDRHERAKDQEFAASQVNLALAGGVNQPSALFRHVSGPRFGKSLGS